MSGVFTELIVVPILTGRGTSPPVRHVLRRLGGSLVLVVSVTVLFHVSLMINYR